jgi:hypothetical protein
MWKKGIAITIGEERNYGKQLQFSEIISMV